MTLCICRVVITTFERLLRGYEEGVHLGRIYFGKLTDYHCLQAIDIKVGVFLWSWTSL